MTGGVSKVSEPGSVGDSAGGARPGATYEPDRELDGDPGTAPPYRSSSEHLEDALVGLDLRIAGRVATLRRAAGEDAGNRHLYVSDDEIERLLVPAAAPEPSDEIGARLAAWERHVAARLDAGSKAGFLPALERLARLFGLGPIEKEALLVCLAPELDRKYDRLYAYLQDDITRRKPSVDLVLDLFAGERTDRWRARPFFLASAPLFHFRLLERSEDPQSPSGSSGLASFLKLDERILGFLLDNPAPAPPLADRAWLVTTPPPLERAPIAEETKQRLLALARDSLGAPPAPGRSTLYLRGPHGVGRRELAMGLCHQLGCSLLVVDAELLPSDPAAAETVIRLAWREGVLQQSGVLLEHLDALGSGASGAGALRRLERVITEYGGLSLLSGERLELSAATFDPPGLETVELPLPPAPVRERAWREALRELAESQGTTCPDTAEEQVVELGRRFRLTPGQIRAAVRSVGRDGSVGEGTWPELGTLARASRLRSRQRLRELATAIEPRRDWDDLVLSEEQLEPLREICQQARHRYRVFTEWGFDRKLSYGKGLSALFSGPPGTGKTLAAEVLANELDLDLFRIDLSTVVSKYIGETEKNLAAIFREAEAANAILFFDEADALFGKRTEVSDAHDRYANIETSYLLQRMEQFEGMTILATNLRQNLDDAFVRRLRFIVELPFPEAEERLRIWHALIPEETPVGPDVDLETLARELEVAGGNIKNIVLHAAFLAAADGGVVGLEHLLRSGRREYEKIGKLWSRRLRVAEDEPSPSRQERTPPSRAGAK